MGIGGPRSRDAAPPLRLALREPLAIPKILAAPLRRVALPDALQRQAIGQPVLVLPGMLSTDRSTSLLRRSLAAAGFAPLVARLGINAVLSVPKLARLETLLADSFQRTGRPVLLIGWSLGGLYARVLAQRHPDMVAAVMTLGTPFSGDRRSNNAWRVYELLARHKVDAPPFPDDPASKPAVMTVAVWSASDGIVAPSAARGLAHESDRQLELPYRHFELGCSRRAVADVVRLALEAVA